MEYDLENLNEFLKNENLKYRIEIGFQLQNSKNNDKVTIGDLSPGEQFILLFKLWKFIYNKYEIAGSTILLMDEPDAHMHP